MRHADHHLADAELAAALEDLLDRRDQRLATVEAEALGADELDAEVALEAFRLDDALEDRAASLDRELGVVLDVLDALLDPRLLVGIGDVHVFDADLAAVGPAQAVPDLAQRRRLAEAQRAEDQDRAIPVGIGEAVGRRVELAVRLLLHEVQRIEVGLEVAADAVRTNQQEGARGVERGRADFLGGLAGQRGRHGGGLAVALDVAVGRIGQGLGIDRADHARAVRRPRGAADLGQHVGVLLGQRIEEGAPLRIDAVGVGDVASEEFLDERGIRAEQERGLLCSHWRFSSSHLSRGGRESLFPLTRGRGQTMWVSPSSLSAFPGPARRAIRQPGCPRRASPRP